MPWTKSDFPDSMKNLPLAVRHKAIEIANALVEEEEMEDGIAIATAISRAKDWAQNHGKAYKSRKARSTDAKKHGRDRYVIPYEDEWAIRIEGKARVEKIFHRKQDAVAQARKEARAVNGSLTIQRKTGKVEKRVSYNPNRRTRPAARRTPRHR